MSESEFQHLLGEHRRGAAGLDALHAALVAQLEHAPHEASVLRDQLERAREQGLAREVYRQLRAHLDAVSAQDPHSDERTRILPGGSGGKAVPAAEGGAARAASGAAAAPPASTAHGDGSDRTRVLPGGTGGRRGGDRSPAPAAGDDTGTGVRAAQASPEDPTEVRSDPRGDAATHQHALRAIADAHDDTTAVQRTTPAGDDEVFDPGAPAGSDRTVVLTGSPASVDAAPTAAPPASAAARAPEFAPGYVIKDRFRLVEILGEGGMGAVWKAVDKLKEEARDRNPFVAVKLLAGDFRNHPEAFIALQRESAKQQRLAHPNIATVYDFDRDGDTVYMTMEVMTGTPMDRYINALPAQGLPYADAIPIIEELGAGLAYAHQAELVHSDLKPGNAFLTRDNHVKLLDFGIARASKTRTDAEGERTIFDPGQLGALTPTYASIEMFEGMDPDPRDDIYALAIIAYQLFTGRHPFGKKSAPTAKELGLVPEPIAKLTRRQNRALLRGLALERAGRTPSVEEFLDGLRPYRNKMPWIVGGSIAAAIVIGMLAYAPVIEYFQQREREAIVAVFMQGGQQDIDRAMAMVAALESPAQREAIAADPRTRKAIIDLHLHRRKQLFDPAQQRFDHAGAIAVMDELAGLYPDSAEVLTLRTELDQHKSRVLGEQTERYTRLLSQGALLPDADAEDIGDVRAILRAIDPQHALLEDPRLPARFAELARDAMAVGRWEHAASVLTAGRALVGEQQVLELLHAEVQAQLARIAEQRRVAQLEALIEGRAFTALADYEAVRAPLRELSELDPEHRLLARIVPGLADAFARGFARRLDAGEIATAQQDLLAWAALLGLERVRGHRDRLAGTGAALPAPAEGDVRARAERVEVLLAAPAFDARWQPRLEAAFAELLALGGAGDAAAARLRERIVVLHLEHAAAARDAQRFEDALALLAHAAVFAPGDAALSAQREATVAAREQQRAREAQVRRLAHIEALRAALLAHAQADRVQQARAVLEELRAALPPDDDFLATHATDAIAQAALRLAQTAFEEQQFEIALAWVRNALEVAPRHAQLASAQQHYLGAVIARALAMQSRRGPGIADNAPHAAVRTAPEPASIRLAAAPAADDTRVPAPGTHRLAALDTPIAARIAERIAAGAQGSPVQVAALAGPAAGFRALFPGRYGALESALESTLAARLDRMAQAKDVKSHNTLLAAARRIPVLRGRGDIEGPKPSKLIAELGLAQLGDGALTAALRTADKAEAEQPDATNLGEFRTAIAARKDQAEGLYKQFERSEKARRLPAAKQSLERAIALWSDNPAYVAALGKLEDAVAVRRGACVASLAGYGQRQRGTCNDEIAGGKGPELVVVPGAGGGTPFAIGKYEITIGHFNRYCKTTGTCPPLAGNAGLPATGMPLDAMRGYAQWLSQQSGATYRLPTEAEWEHAAMAGGEPQRASVNCRVMQGGAVVAGHSLVNAGSGQQNGWGLVNHVGNAREVVTTARGAAARGGAFTDPLVRCEVGMREADGTAPDPATGFRLVRELR